MTRRSVAAEGPRGNGIDVTASEWRFSFVLSVSGIPDEFRMDESTYVDFVRTLRELGIPFDETDPGESEYGYLATECGEPDEGSFWARWKDEVRDLTASGVLDSEQLRELVDGTGTYADDSETMGTLGGPLGLGCVPDINFSCESSQTIVCLRVTPFCDSWDEEKTVTAEEWDAIKTAVREAFGC